MPSGRDWAVVRVKDVDSAWPVLSADLKMAFDKVESDLDAALLFRAARQGVVSFWVAEGKDGHAGSISVAHLPDGTGDILTIAGRQAVDWIPAEFGRWAAALKGLGIKRLVFGGRAGWKKIMKPLGFHEEGTPSRAGLVTMNRVL